MGCRDRARMRKTLVLFTDNVLLLRCGLKSIKGFGLMGWLWVTRVLWLKDISAVCSWKYGFLINASAYIGRSHITLNFVGLSVKWTKTVPIVDIYFSPIPDTSIVLSVLTIRSSANAFNLIKLTLLPVSWKNFPLRFRSSGADISTTGDSIVELVQWTVPTSPEISRRVSCPRDGSRLVDSVRGSPSDSGGEPPGSLRGTTSLTAWKKGDFCDFFFSKKVLHRMF